MFRRSAATAGRGFHQPGAAFFARLAGLGALLAAAAGCGAPAPIEGEALERLKADLRAARPKTALVDMAAPAAADRRGVIVLPYVAHGDKVAEFALYDREMKVAFTVVDEFRALGIHASLPPLLWKRRVEDVLFEARTLDDRAVRQNLVQLGAQSEVAELWRLSPDERRRMLASMLVLLDARTALPASLRAARPGITAREIRDLYFGDDRPYAPYMILLRGSELEASAEEGLRGGRRHGRARLTIQFWRTGDAGPEIYGEFACEAEAEGSGVRREKVGPGFVLEWGSDDPLDRAIRGCVRAFVAEALRQGRL